MRLPPFRLHRPATAKEALDLLSRHGQEARVYMGGTELLLLMKRGLARPGHLIDCKGVPELSGLDLESDGEWTIGAATTHRQIELSAQVARRLPELVTLERDLANVRVRNTGTLGGNLCFAEPHSDPATLLIALGASIEVISPTGLRRVPLEDFILWAYTTVLKEGEIMTRVLIPPLDDEAVASFERLAYHDRPIVNIAYVRRGDDHRVVAGAVGVRPTRLHDAERLLAAGEAIPAVVAAAMDQVEPQQDAEATVEYKRHLVGVLVKKALARG